MADTIVNTPASNDSGAAGWVVALVVIVAVAVAGFVWYRNTGAYQTPAQEGATNINVTIPAPVTGTGGGTAN